MWQAELAEPRSGTPYMAFIYGKESDGDVPGTPEWDAGAAEHGRFAEVAGDAIVAGGALHPVDTTTTVRVRDGELLVTDGPFSETAEVVGGFYVLSAPDADAAAGAGRADPRGPGRARSRSARSSTWATTSARRRADAGEL